MLAVLSGIGDECVGTAASSLARPAREDAVQRILNAFMIGTEKAWSPPSTGPTANRVATEGKRTLRMGPLPPADRVALTTLSDPRERGLAHARTNELAQATASMRAARLLLALAQLSPAGRAYAETMQSAAESYVSYQRRDYDAAFAQMQKAIDATNQLGFLWGECEFVLCRRIDLGHNLMRVDMRRGMTSEASARGLTLLESAAAAVDQLGVYVTGMLCDLVTSTIAELATPLSRNEARTLLSPLFSTCAARPLPSARAEAWIAIEQMTLAEPSRVDVTAIEQFLAAGRERTPVLWYATALDAARACEMLDVDSGADVADAIFAALASADRIPDGIRALAATPAAQRRSIPSLLRRAHDAFTQGRGRPWNTPALDAAQVAVEADVSSRLTPNDRLALARLAPPREQALSLARRNDIAAARASMRLARLTLSLVECSAECRLYAQTLHEAAESYLAYRAGDFPAAITTMRSSMTITDELAKSWTECPFIVFRRIHLQHNLMRVHVSTGDSVEAMTIAKALLALLAPMTDSETAELFFNTVLSTVAELLVRLTLAERQRLLPSLQELRIPATLSWRGCEWLRVAFATLHANPRPFLTLAETFLRGGRQSAAALWYAVAHDLVVVYDRWSPGAPAAADLRIELGTAAGVPVRMRRP